MIPQCRRTPLLSAEKTKAAGSGLVLEGGVLEIDLANAVRGADSEIELEFIVEWTAEAKPIFKVQVLTWVRCLFEASSLG